MLTLSEARRIIEGAILRARKLNANISVAVCDNRGQLIALNRMDGATDWDVDRGAIGKALAAAMIGRPSEGLVERLLATAQRHASYASVVSPRGQRGGLPLFQEGVIEGGCGVGGAPTFEQDEECAYAGIAALDNARSDQSFGSSIPQVAA